MSSVLMALWAAVVAAIILVKGDSGGAVLFSLFLAYSLVLVWWAVWKEPRVLVADDVGLTFLGRSRSVEVPWASLRSVSVPWYIFGRGALQWQVAGRRRLSTSGRWENFDRLLAIIKARAPGAEIWL